MMCHCYFVSSIFACFVYNGRTTRSLRSHRLAGRSVSYSLGPALSAGRQRTHKFRRGRVSHSQSAGASRGRAETVPERTARGMASSLGRGRDAVIDLRHAKLFDEHVDAVCLVPKVALLVAHDLVVAVDLGKLAARLQALG